MGLVLKRNKWYTANVLLRQSFPTRANSFAGSMRRISRVHLSRATRLRTGCATPVYLQRKLLPTNCRRLRHDAPPKFKRESPFMYLVPAIFSINRTPPNPHSVLAAHSSQPFLKMTKRVSCSCAADGASAKRAAAMVSLNVGGKRFDTTKETLCRASYFRPYLEGNICILPTKQMPPHPPPPIARPTGACCR